MSYVYAAEPFMSNPQSKENDVEISERHHNCKHDCKHVSFNNTSTILHLKVIGIWKISCKKLSFSYKRTTVYEIFIASKRINIQFQNLQKFGIAQS